MTISSESRSTGLLVGDGADTTFSFGFKCYTTSDLAVIHQDADGDLTDLVESVDYSVALNADQDASPGGVITYPLTGSALPATEWIIGLSGTPYKQLIDLRNAGAFREQTIEQQFDRIIMMLQKMNEQIRRFPKLPYDAVDSVITTLAAARADGFLAFDPSGALTVKTALMDATTLSLTAYIEALLEDGSITSDSTFQDAIGIATYAKTLLDDTTSAAARATLEVDHAIQNNEYTYFVCTGTAPNYVLTPSPAITGSLSAGQIFNVKFHSDGTTGSNDLNISTLGAVSLKQYDSEMNLRDAVIKSGMQTPVLYDGSYLIVMSPLRIEPVSYVRQTVQAGPGDGQDPTLLPATATGLDLTSQNITSSVPLIVSAANGSGLGSDRLGEATGNLTWSSLTDATTNYIYVDIASDGSLTTGFTTTAPVFQPEVATTAPSVTNGVHTFDYTKMEWHVGNGSTADTGTFWRVFIGEVTTSGGNVTATLVYNYNGKHHYSGTGGLAINSDYYAVHNIGAPVVIERFGFICLTNDFGYLAGDIVEANMGYHYNNLEYGSAYYIPAAAKYRQVIMNTMGNGVVYVPRRDNLTNRTFSAGTPANWDFDIVIKRAF